MSDLLNEETPPSERPQLFIKKLHQCRVLFDFNDASAELKGKQIKAQTLHEMLEYITTQRGVITENVYPEVVNMVCISIWNALDLCLNWFTRSLRPTSSAPYPLL
jgi:serine/threonine-protein phosphatase 2A regulatory subunit B'